MKRAWHKFIGKHRTPKGGAAGNANGNVSGASDVNANGNPAPSSANDPPPIVKADSAQQVMAATTAGTLSIALQNKTTSSTVYAYITGQAIDNGSKPMFIQSDGHTVYYPASPSSPGAALAQNCAIPLGAPGNTVTATIPRIAGGRIWYSIGAPINFYLNPGPAIVEPSVTNYSDTNINTNWSFCEFTFNDQQLFANITMVDFVGIPVGLTLTNTSGATQTVPGMPANGLTTLVNSLKTQTAADGQPWSSLVYSTNGSPLRALSPQNYRVTNPDAFSTYWDSYISQVWSKFSSTDLTVNTQASYGNLTGRISNNVLDLGVAGTFAKPSAADIFSCSTGPFATGSNDAANAVIPRLAAAFNRSTLLLTSTFPDGSTPANYYQNATTNHYSRLVHTITKDNRGYAFPYDDVVPDGGSDVAGTVMDGSPTLLTVIIGGN